MNKKWFVYIILTEDDFFYTGITLDLKRRFEEHQSNPKKAAKYLKSHRPKEIVYFESCPDRSSASKRESEIKKMTRSRKELLMRENRSSLKKSKIIRLDCSDK